MNLLQIIIALIALESGGNDRAEGPQGEAGCLQIRKIVVDDINRNILHQNRFTYYDRFDRLKSVQMAELYLDFYCTEKRLGHIPTEQDAARSWNGGPQGFKRRSTIQYWERYKAERKRH